MDDNNALKFLHFNVGNEGHDQKTFSKRMLHVWQNRTVAVLALSPRAIQRAVSEFLDVSAPMTVDMAIGVTYVSKNDLYDKKVGRDQSVKAMKEVEIEVASIEVNENHIFLRLKPYEGIRLTARLNRKTGFSTVTGEITGRAEDRK